MTCDVLVIGGGLLGCATAWMLARDGASVVLLERDQVNQHASGRNAGSLHFQLEYRMVEHGIETARRAAEALPLHLDAARRWQAIAHEFGEEVAARQTGGVMLAETQSELELLAAKAELERSWGLDVTVVAGAQLRQLAPYLSTSVRAAAYCPLEGKADTRRAAPAMARAAIRHGAHVHTQTKVDRIERSGGRWQVTATDYRSDGAPAPRTFSADSLIVAAGVWTTEVGNMLGASLPTTPLPLMMTVTLRQAPFVPHLVQHAGKRLSLKQSVEGNVLIGGGWPARFRRADSGVLDLDAPPELLRSSAAGNAQAALSVIPELRGVPVLRTWTGSTTVTPDQLPLVGPVDDCPGVFVATGGSAFTLGPTFAHALSEQVQGRVPDFDLTPYHPGRYGPRSHA